MVGKKTLFVGGMMAFVVLGGCKDLLKKVGASKGDSGATAADAGPTAQASASASAEPEDSAAASAEPAPEELKLPGSCVDPKGDAEKRASGMMPGASVDADMVDLDGDGKKDRVYTATMQDHTVGWIYVMRGTCGYYLGDFPPSDGHKITGLKSHGLRSLEIDDVDHACGGTCGCESHATPLFFNGAKYVLGKPKDTTQKCGAKALPACAAGQSLYAEDEDATPFCSKPCNHDADCGSAKCSVNGFTVDPKTGTVYTGVGKSTMVCSKGGSAPSGAPTALTVPPGAPGVIPNPKLLDCPSGYTKLLGTKTCNKSCAHDKCPAGTTCRTPMSYCM